MIVVMPQGHALQSANVGPLVRLTGEADMFSKRFPQDLLQEVVPLIERNYRVYTDADHLRPALEPRKRPAQRQAPELKPEGIACNGSFSFSDAPESITAICDDGRPTSRIPGS